MMHLGGGMVCWRFVVELSGFLEVGKGRFWFDFDNSLRFLVVVL